MGVLYVCVYHNAVLEVHVPELGTPAKLVNFVAIRTSTKCFMYF